MRPRDARAPFLDSNILPVITVQPIYTPQGAHMGWGGVVQINYNLVSDRSADSQGISGR